MSTREKGKPVEREAVTTTIVGGRPPGSGQEVGAIPRGIEILVKKAAVDAEFRTKLIEQRSRSANEIGLLLQPAEAMMLDAVPKEQLEKIIAATHVKPEVRAAFMGKVAALMLAAIGMQTVGCDNFEPPASTGIRPGPPPAVERPVDDSKSTSPAPVPQGIRPDQPPKETTAPAGATETTAPAAAKPANPHPISRGIRPDRPQVTTPPAGASQTTAPAGASETTAPAGARIEIRSIPGRRRVGVSYGIRVDRVPQTTAPAAAGQTTAPAGASATTGPASAAPDNAVPNHPALSKGMRPDLPPRR